MKHNKEHIRCSYDNTDVVKVNCEEWRRLFKHKPVKGFELNRKYSDTIFGNFITTKLFLVTVVHVVGVPDSGGRLVPIQNADWIEYMFRVANDIWSQACIELVPHQTGILVTEFRDISLSAFAGLCLAPGQFEMVAPYDITVPQVNIVNIYLVEDTNGIACGSPVSGRVFLPTAGRSPEYIGRVLAHELGHILLNPVGVSDSSNPDHLMFHPSVHPEISPQDRDGLFLSDCIGARTTAQENLFVFSRPGGLDLTNPGDAVSCTMSPKLGNNLAIVATEFARK